jgi:protein TonB
MKADVGTVVLAGLALLMVAGGRAEGVDAAEAPVRFTQGGAISEPQVKEKVPPSYPEQARKERIQGTVVLDAVVEADGTIGTIEVVRSDHELLSEAAVEAVRHWRYEPARDEDGRAVAVIYSVTINFRLS